MSIPPDDPAHRPPPPRQGEPPYPGAYPPPRPTGHWQGQSGAYGPPPGYARGGGMMSSLFDFTFDHMVTPQLIKGAYRLAVVLVSLFSVFWLVVGVWLFQYGYLITVFVVLFTPPLWLASLLGIRMFMEFLINQFKITEHLKAMRERG